MWGIHISKLDLCYAPDIEQGGYGSTNVTFPISFSRVFTPLITAMNDLKTQNNLHINSYWNTGFNCYNNGYAILWIAFGV